VDRAGRLAQRRRTAKSIAPTTTIFGLRCIRTNMDQALGADGGAVACATRRPPVSQRIVIS